MNKLFLIGLLDLLFAGSLAAQQLSLGLNGDLHGWRPFAADSAWNQRIDSAPLDPNSKAVIAAIGDHGLFVDPEIPYWVVDGKTQPFVPVTIEPSPDSNGEAYAAPYTSGAVGNVTMAPIPTGEPWMQAPPATDCHGILIDKAAMTSYEFWIPKYVQGESGKPPYWRAAVMVTWNLLAGDAQHPYTWTSANGAGFSYFAGLLKYEEATSPNGIQHALFFTLAPEHVAGWFTPPAMHQLTANDNIMPGMGARLRLRKDFDVSKFPPEDQAILNAAKTYGLILGDLGADLYISATKDARWNIQNLTLLRQVKASDFEVVNVPTTERFNYRTHP